MKLSVFARLSLSLPVVLACVFAGCSDRDGGKPKIRTKEGTIKKIDLQNRTVSMEIKNKDGETIVLPGTFRDDTVIKINGRVATVKDVREGDTAVVQGYREGEGLNQKWIAQQVTIERPNEMDWKSTGGASGTTGGAQPAPTT